jgi:pimeloyl-ACP methyl ester carboxylesterase
VVQLLLDRGLGAAGIALDPAPVKGVHPGLTASRASLSVFTSWRGWRRVQTMSEKSFDWGFVNALPPSERRAAYREQLVQAPGRMFFQAALGRGNSVNFANPSRPPLLLIVGSQDRTVEPSMVRRNFRLASRSPSPTEFHEFPGRCHFLIGQPGWEEVADYTIAWCDRMEAAHALGAQPQAAGTSDGAELGTQARR